jgi:hypothetical protein
VAGLSREAIVDGRQQVRSGRARVTRTLFGPQVVDTSPAAAPPQSAAVESSRA